MTETVTWCVLNGLLCDQERNIYHSYPNYTHTDHVFAVAFIKESSIGTNICLSARQWHLLPTTSSDNEQDFFLFSQNWNIYIFKPRGSAHSVLYSRSSPLHECTK